MKRLIYCLILVLSVLYTVVPALADVEDLDEDLPTELEDATATDFGDKQIQGVIRFAKQDKGVDLWLYQPSAQFGILPNTQLNLSANLYSGNGDKTGNGDLIASLLYQFNEESASLPATAVAVKGEFPTGDKSRGVDYDIKLIFSKSPFAESRWLDRLHLNLIYKHNSGRDSETERADMFKGIFGITLFAGSDNLLILDYVREMEREKGQDSNLIELGFRREISESTLFTVGAGAGIGEESERYRLTLAMQYSF